MTLFKKLQPRVVNYRDYKYFEKKASLKKANITPTFKKGDRTSKDNYRPVSILPKIFQQCIFRQLYNFMLEFLSKYQCSFCKGYSMQHCMLAMLEKWKSAVDKGKSLGI